MKRAIKKVEKALEKKVRKSGLKGKNLLWKVRDLLSAVSPNLDVPLLAKEPKVGRKPK